MNQSRVSHNKKNYHSKKIFVLYTIVFFIVFLFTLGLFLIAGKSFIWVSDPYHQHLPAVYYFSEYMREGISSLLHGNLNFPTFDLSIGYGSDVLTTLNYYAFGDPLNILYIFFNPKYTEYVYIFLASFRLYLSGFTFLLFTRQFKSVGFSEIFGAIVYSFSGYAIISTTLHPFFINAMIYFPLVLLGVEKIFNGKRPTLFILSMSVSLISNFYFAYMILLLAFVYALIRYFFKYNRRTVKHFFNIILQFMMYVINSILISSFIFIPVLISFIGNGRGEMGKSENFFFYPITYYFEVFQNMFSPVSGSTAAVYWSNISVATIGFFAIITCLTIKKTRILSIYFFVSIAILSLPILGKMFNGFSYVTNRWLFAYVFLISYMVSRAIPLLVQLSKKEILKLSIVTLIYALLLFLLQPFYNANTLLTIVNLLLLLLIIVILSIQDSISLSKKTLVLGCSATVSMILLLSYKIMPMSANYLELGSVVQNIKMDAESKVKEFSDSSEYRVSSENLYSTPTSYNSSLINKVNGLSNYFSIIPQETIDFMEDINSSDQRNVFMLTGLDDRLYLQTLFSTKYFATSNANSLVPYGYKKVNDIMEKNNINLKENINYCVYKNDFALPLGYSYNHLIDKEEFEKLNPVVKQETMLDAVVLKESNKKISSLNKKTNVKSKPFSITKSDGVEISDNQLHVLKPDASITLTFNGDENSETYFYLKGIAKLSLDIKPKSNKRDFERIRDQYNQFYSAKETKMSITANGTRSNYKTIYSIDNKYYEENTNLLINTGYSKNGQSTIVVKFSNAGKFKFDSMEVITQSMDNLENQVDELRSQALNVEKIKGNTIKGRVNFSENRFLVFSIPYSRGWKLTIDGEKKKLETANIMFMGTEVEPGSHTIELHYDTPGFKLGTAMTVIGIGLLIVIDLFFIKFSFKSSQDEKNSQYSF